MKFYKGIKTALLLAIVTVLFLFGLNKTFASDYQYKILDPKYNPAAEKLINGNLPTMEEEQLTSKQEGFNFIRFLAIFATIAFPILVLALVNRVYKKLLYGIPSTDSTDSSNLELGKVKIEGRATQEFVADGNKDALVQLFDNSNDGLMFLNIKDAYTAKENAVNTTISECKVVDNNLKNVISNPVRSVEKPVEKFVLEPSKTLIQQEDVLKRALTATLEQHMKKTATATIPKRNPMLLNTAPLTKEKGLCLVEYENKYSLFGYIKDKIFFLNQFETLKSSEIRPRLTERNNGKDRYLVRLGAYKGLIEVSDSDMHLLINL